jgi:SAM-dependent methyltransferase
MEQPPQQPLLQQPRDEASAPVPARVDIRDRESFLALHLRNACHLPYTEFSTRLFELPPPCGDKAVEPLSELSITYDREEIIDEVVELLESRGYSIVERVPAKSLPERKDCISGRGTYIWKPNPALVKCWDRILAHAAQHPEQKRICLDLAAGNGRDLVFAAMEGYHGLGIDYSERQWSKMDAIASRVKQELSPEELQKYGSVRSNNLDLEKDPEQVVEGIIGVMKGELPSLIIVSRYLHRPLLPHIHKLLVPGGLLLYHTFMEGAESVGRKTPSRPRFLLKPTELRDVFENEFEILEDSVWLLPDKRPTSCFLARKIDRSKQ